MGMPVRCVAVAGFASGPRRFQKSRMRSFFRTGAAKRSAPWKTGANKKTKPNGKTGQSLQ